MACGWKASLPGLLVVICLKRLVTDLTARSRMIARALCRKQVNPVEVVNPKSLFPVVCSASTSIFVQSLRYRVVQDDLRYSRAMYINEK